MSQLTMQDDLARQGRFHSSVIWLTLSGLVLFIVWSSWAVLDEVTVGTGKVTPSTRAQVIESLDGGIVSELMVKEGDIVARGQMLARLDPTRFQSNYGEAAARVRALRASSERLRSEQQVSRCALVGSPCASLRWLPVSGSYMSRAVATWMKRSLICKSPINW